MAWIDGRRKNLQHRKYCLNCSPFGSHNTRRLQEVARSKEVGILCRKCAAPLTFSQRKGRICWNCYYKARSDRRMDQAYSLVGEACWRCGYTKGRIGRRLLDFHHVDRATKSFSLDARHVVNLSWDRVLSEMTKCVLLCANCHREVECGLVSDEEIATIHANRWDGRSIT
jgi:hypothetical protein